jgi:hypothetical protein
MAKDNGRKQTQKTILGMPVRWERKKMFKNLWNKEDDRIFLPKYFGVGWDLNFHALVKRTGLIKPTAKSE